MAIIILEQLDHRKCNIVLRCSDIMPCNLFQEAQNHIQPQSAIQMVFTNQSTNADATCDMSIEPPAYESDRVNQSNVPEKQPIDEVNQGANINIV